MKNTILIVMMGTLISCSSSNSKKSGPTFDYLIGNWERTNGRPGTQTMESWKKLDNQTYKAISVTLKGKDTVYMEHCTIRKEEGNYYYIADVPQNQNPTKFKIVEFTNESFKAVNPEHDFPREINYRVSGNTITASISGGEKQIDYNFKKQ